MRKIHILHEFFVPSHFYALEALAREHGYRLVYHEFELASQWREWKRKPLKKLRVFSNICFLVSLLFRGKCKVVMGIAPYNYKLLRLLPLLKRHSVYYFTSFTCWDGSSVVHSKHDSPRLREAWKKFIQQDVAHVFAVSEKTKCELVRNGYATPDKVSVVNHSYGSLLPCAETSRKSNRFIYVGRLIECKGIRELLSIFTQRPNAVLTLIGNGELQPLVEEYAAGYPNIRYEGYKQGLSNIAPLYRENSFFILNSCRVATWEELFGISLIESMASGCVPLATDHSGPCEIITDGKDGFLCHEGEIARLVDRCLNMQADDYSVLRKNAVERGREFVDYKVAGRWSAVLK